MRDFGRSVLSDKLAGMALQIAALGLNAPFGALCFLTTPLRVSMLAVIAS